MKRTLILLLLFLVLGGGAAWYLTQGEEEKTSLIGSDREFAVPVDEVYKIFIADRLGEQTTLSRKGDSWVYNEKYEAREAVVKPILQAVGNMRVQYKPPKAAEENMIKVLASQGIKVELYDKGDNLIKSYYLGGATSDERGTFGIIDGAEQPYVIEIPAWEGNLSTRFRRSGDEWRDKLLFEEEVENIKSVSIEYPKQKQNSFVLEHKSRDEYDVSPFYDVTPKINSPLKAGKVEAYLVNFKKLSAEAFRNDHSARDSITSLIPFSIITLTTQDDEETQIKLYPIVPDQSIYQDGKSGDYLITSGQIERYFVDVNGEDFMLAQNLLIKKILWPYAAFFDEGPLLN